MKEKERALTRSDQPQLRAGESDPRGDQGGNSMVRWVRTFKSGWQNGVGQSGVSWFVYTRPKDGCEWSMHCGPYSDEAQAVEWITMVRQS